MHRLNYWCPKIAYVTLHHTGVLNQSNLQFNIQMSNNPTGWGGDLFSLSYKIGLEICLCVLITLLSSCLRVLGLLCRSFWSPFFIPLKPQTAEYLPPLFILTPTEFYYLSLTFLWAFCFIHNLLVSLSYFSCLGSRVHLNLKVKVMFVMSSEFLGSAFTFICKQSSLNPHSSPRVSNLDGLNHLYFLHLWNS